MNIGDVSQLSGVPAKTIRYYEDIGLIKPLRGDNGYRSFQDRDLYKLAFLGRARSLGFSIEDCRSLLELYENDGRASADVKQIGGEASGSDRREDFPTPFHAKDIGTFDRCLRGRSSPRLSDP